MSVSDKSGIVELCKYLASKNVQLLSTGGTSRKLKEAGLQVMDVSEYVSFILLI